MIAVSSLQLIRARSILARLLEITRELPVAAPEQQMMLFREKKALADELRGTSGYLRKAGLTALVPRNAPWAGGTSANGWELKPNCRVWACLAPRRQNGLRAA